MSLACEILDLLFRLSFALFSFLHDTLVERLGFVWWVGGRAGTVPIELVFKWDGELSYLTGIF